MLFQRSVRLVIRHMAFNRVMTSSRSTIRELALMYSLLGNASADIPSAWSLNKLKAKLPVNHLNRFIGAFMTLLGLATRLLNFSFSTVEQPNSNAFAR